MYVRFSVLWKVPLPPRLRCLCRTQWTHSRSLPLWPVGTVPAPELSTREEFSESVTHRQVLFLLPETIFSVKTWRTRHIHTHEGTEFEWEGEGRAEIELQQARVTAEPSFPSYVAAATPTVPRQEWHAAWMRWKSELSRDFPLNKEKHTLCRNTLIIKNKKNLCFTVVPNR